MDEGKSKSLNQRNLSHMNSMKDMDNGNPLDTPKIAGLRDSKEQANR